MNLLTVLLLIILFCAFGGSAPVWSHSVHWGYAPSGTLFFIFLVVLILALTGRI